MKEKLNRQEWSWILYDCGNSAYSMAITTAFLPLYFTMFKEGGGMDLGYFNSLASIIIALMSPILGTYADYIGEKKKLFTFFAIAGMIATAALAFVPYGNWQLLVFLFILSAIGFSGSNVFYDSFLVDTTTNERMDKVSSFGFAFGYIASILPFGLSLVVIYLMGMDQFIGFQISFIITALWWFVLTIPLWKNVEQKYGIPPQKQSVLHSFKRLGSTLAQIRKYREAFIFLIAYFLYIDGVDTIIKMVIPYSEQVLGGASFDMFMLLGILLILQLVAFPFAIFYGLLAKRFGTKKMIQVGIATYIIAVFFAARITSVREIFVLGALIGSAQGGIQALSRSYFAKIIPKENSNEFFGFYNIFGKFAAILGPFVMSFITDTTGNARLSIFGILPLFILGFIITLFLKEKEN